MNQIKSFKRISGDLSNEKRIKDLILKMAKSKAVFMGESSHGTSEFYTTRADLSKKLISDYNFKFISVDGNWSDCLEINNYIKGLKFNNSYEALQTFEGWPSWVWANEEMIQLIEWLKEYNLEKKEVDRIGFYGLDVYGLWKPLNAVIQHLQIIDPDIVPEAKETFKFFSSFIRDKQEMKKTNGLLSKSNEDKSVKTMVHNLEKIIKNSNDNSDEFFSDKQNASILKNAEKYYRDIIQGGSQSWNAREKHMHQTLINIMDYYSNDSKGIIWGHNSRIGDARATDISNEKMINLGQLSREYFENSNTFLLGFSSFSGSLIAADEWGGAYKKMEVPRAMDGSWEEMLHSVDYENKLIFFDQETPEMLFHKIGHREIGVVYNPDLEYESYLPSILPQRYDAFIYFDESNPVHPLGDLTTEDDYLFSSFSN